MSNFVSDCVAAAVLTGFSENISTEHKLSEGFHKLGNFFNVIAKPNETLKEHYSK